jgi:release factor glutamine methyltransferase
MELPEDYKSGFKYFLGAKIDLSKRPFIPREETEYWVSLAIKEIKDNSICLDLFSGSGCVGVAVLKNINNCYCDFGEKVDLFLEQIQINLDLNEIDSKRYSLIKTDIFSNIEKQYDFMLANPPYVALSRANEVGEDVKTYEPHIALFSGEDGLVAIKEFLLKAKMFLKEKGVIYMEFDEKQLKDIEEIIKNNYSKYEFLKDQFDKYRFIRIEK